jgi:hypothetical protein
MTPTPTDLPADPQEPLSVSPADLVTRPIPWLSAVAVGVIVAGVAAAAVWVFLPVTKYTVRTLLRVPPGGTFLFKTNEPVPALSDHQRTQVALVKSRMVLTQALKNLEGRDLETIRNMLRAGDNPVEWLEENVQADFSVAPEVLKIAVSGYNRDELIAIVQAIHKAYKETVLDREKYERKERQATLHAMRVKYEAELKEAKYLQRKMMEEAGGAKDAAAAMQGQAFLRTQLARDEHELLETQASLRRSKAELTVLQGTQNRLAASFPVPDAEVQAELTADPDVRAAQTQVTNTRDRVEKAAAASKPGDPDPSLQSLRKQLADEQAALAAVKKRLAPDAAERIRDQHRKATWEALKRLEMRIAVDQEIDKALETEVTKLRDKLQQQMQGIDKLEAVREDTTQVEETTKRIAAEEEALKIELEAPERTSVLEEAVVGRTPEVHRPVLATVGTFIGTFALVLLAFGAVAWCSQEGNDPAEEYTDDPQQETQRG